MIRVDTFVDLPKKAFPKNSIQNHIFPGDTILWACAQGQSGVPEFRNRLTPENLSVPRL